MKKQDVIQQLKHLNNYDKVVSSAVVLKNNSVLEKKSYHSGIWNEYEFTCVSHAYWSSSEAKVEIKLGKLIELLDNKDLIQLDSSDFDYVSFKESDNPEIFISAINWIDKEPTDEEKEEDDFEEIELYNNSEINNYEFIFDSGSVLGLAFTIDGNNFIIENNSDFEEESNDNKVSIKIELFSDGMSNKIGQKIKHQEKISEFLKKWETILSFFDDEFLVEDDNEDVWILTTPINPLVVSDEDLYNEDEYLSDKNKAVIAFLNNIINYIGDFKPELGDAGYEDGFYSDVSKLIQLENNRIGFKFNAKLETLEGIGAGTFEFNELGKIIVRINFV